MDRRTLLATTGIALSTPLVGCLSSLTAGDKNGSDNINQTSDDGTGNGQSSSENKSCLRVSELSSAAQNEVETAIGTGEYETCGPLELQDEIELSNNPVIISEETAYEPVIAHGDAGPEAECSSTYHLQMEQINRDRGC